MQEADRRNKLKSGSNNINETIAAEKNLQDVIELLANLRQNREPLLHCAVFIELRARNQEKLRELQSEISLELTRSKISVDRLTLRQREGFLSVLPVGTNQFGAQFERVLPASSVANLYPFNFSGKADSHGLYDGEVSEPLVWRQGSRVSMRVARASASLLSSHGRVPGTSPG